MSSTEPEQISADDLIVRTYRPHDQPDVNRLYTDGLLHGQLAPNDTGADIENIHDAYFQDPQSHFWIAEYHENIVGMIGVARDSDHRHTGEVRRLRVEKNLQHTCIGEKLIETALLHCKQSGFLKIVFDTRFETSTTLPLFERLGFQHTRTKNIHGKELLEFYLDLYHRQREE